MGPPGTIGQQSLSVVLVSVTLLNVMDVPRLIPVMFVGVARVHIMVVGVMLVEIALMLKVLVR